MELEYLLLINVFFKQGLFRVYENFGTAPARLIWPGLLSQMARIPLYLTRDEKRDCIRPRTVSLAVRTRLRWGGLGL